MPVKLSRAARRMYQKGGGRGLHSDHQLLLEIVSLVGEIDRENLERLAEEVTAWFGSSANALQAIRRGEVIFQGVRL